MKTLPIKQIINESWLKVADFKAAFWLGTIYAFIAYLIVACVSVIFLLLANYGIAWLILAGIIYLGGLFFLFLPLTIGVLRLSILHMRGEPVEAKSVIRYLTGSVVFKIGIIAIVSFFVSLLLSAVPSIFAQVILTFVFIWINAITLLALLCVADQDMSVDKIVLFLIDALKHNWWQLFVLILLGYLLLFAGIITLGIGFIWLSPWYNNVWGQAYNILMERQQHDDQHQHDSF